MNVVAQSLIQEIDDSPDARFVTHPLMGQKPQHAAMSVARRDTPNEVRVRVTDDAR